MSTIVDQMARTYLQLKSQIKSLEEQLELVRDDIEKVMEEQNKTKIITESYSIDKRSLVTERLCKEKVPLDVWNQYKSISSHSCLYVRPVATVVKKRSSSSRKRYK
jgi:hypothetical protein